MSLHGVDYAHQVATAGRVFIRLVVFAENHPLALGAKQVIPSVIVKPRANAGDFMFFHGLIFEDLRAILRLILYFRSVTLCSAENQTRLAGHRQS